MFFLLFQQLRKLLLEIIHRIPSNEHLKKYVQQILSLMFKLLKVTFDKALEQDIDLVRFKIPSKNLTVYTRITDTILLLNSCIYINTSRYHVCIILFYNTLCLSFKLFCLTMINVLLKVFKKYFKISFNSLSVKFYSKAILVLTVFIYIHVYELQFM